MQKLGGLAQISQLHSNLPASLSSSSSGFEDYGNGGGGGGGGQNDGSNYDTNYNYDDKSSSSNSDKMGRGKNNYDDIRSLTTSSSPKSRYSGGNSFPGSRFPPRFPPPEDIFRDFSSDRHHTEKDGNSKGNKDSFSSNDGYDDYSDKDRDRGYFDNTYYPTEDSNSNNKKQSGGGDNNDDTPFFPSHGVPTSPHKAPSYRPLQTPQEYRLPLYTNNYGGVASLRGKNYNAIPNSNQKLGLSMSYYPGGRGGSSGGGGGSGVNNELLGYHHPDSHPNFVDPTTRHHQLLSRYASGNKSPSRGEGFPYGLPLPPIPPGFGGQDYPESNPRGNKKANSRETSYSRGYVPSSPYDHFPHASAPTQVESYGAVSRKTSSSSPRKQDDGEDDHHQDDDDDTSGYSGLTDRPPPPAPTPSSSSRPIRYNEYGYPTTTSTVNSYPTTPPSPTSPYMLSAENDYQNQIQLTNAANFGLSAPLTSQLNNYPLLTNALNGLSAASAMSPASPSLYDGLAGYGLGTSSGSAGFGGVF